MRPFSSRRRLRKTSMPSGGLLRKTPGSRRPGGNGDPRHLSPAGETSSDRNQAAGRNAAAGAFLDPREIPQLCDRLPPRNGPVAGDRRAAGKARPERGSGKAVLVNSRATALMKRDEKGT